MAFSPFGALPRLSGLRPVEEEDPGPTVPPIRQPLTPTELLGEDSPGMLSQIGDILDRPGNALRGVLAGKPGALMGMVPFSQSMGLFNDEDRVSGQDVLTEWGAIDKPADSILSGEGAAGLAAEMVLDPLNLVGIGLLTKGGKAAKAVQGTLKATRGLAAEARAARAAGNVAKAEQLTNRLRQIGQGIRTGDTAAGKAFQEARKIGGGRLPKMADTWGGQADAGQRALLSIGGETSLFPFAPSINLPESVAIKGAPALEHIAEAGQWLKGAPVVKQVGQLFSKTPAGVDPESARIIKDEMDAATIMSEAGIERAAAEAGQLDVGLRKLAPVEELAPLQPLPGGAARVGADLVDPETGEVLAGAGKLAEAQKIQNDAVEYAQAMRNRAEAAEQALKDARQAPAAPPAATVEGPRVDTPRAPALPSEIQAPPPAAVPVEAMPAAPAVDQVAARAERITATRQKQLADRNLTVGAEVFYTPEGFRKPQRAKVTAITPDGRVAVEWVRTGTEKAGKYGKKSVRRQGADIVEPVEVELPRQKQAQIRRGQQDAELANLPRDVRRSVRGQAADANIVSDAVNVEELERAAVMAQPKVAGALKTKRRNEFVEMIGNGPDAVQRAAGFPKTLEKALRQVPVENLPPLKTVEFKPHAVEAPTLAEALEEGDKFRLAGDTFTVKELTPDGKVRVKDGLDLRFPPGAIPVDRGAPIVKARRPVEDLPPIPKAEPVEMAPAIKAPPIAPATMPPPPAILRPPTTPPPAKLAKAQEALAKAQGKAGVQTFKKNLPNLEYSREQFRMDIERQFRLKPAEADAVLAVTDARAQTWTNTSGKPPERWYAERLAAVRRGSAGELIAQGVPEELAQRARGATEWYMDGRAIIKALKGGKVDTVLHELGHVFRKELQGVDLDAVEQAFSVGGKWTRESEERFAQSFERYLQSGQAPTKALAGVFEQFKSWLANIWKALRNKPDVEVSPEVRAVFDRMLGKLEPGELIAGDMANRRAWVKTNWAKLAAKGDQGELFPVELTKEEAKARKVAKAHDEAGGGQLFQMAGEKSTHTIGQKQQLDLARNMAKELGVASVGRLTDVERAANEKIRLATGWFKGVDGKWRYEIADNNAKWKLPYKYWYDQGQAPSVGTAIERLELMKTDRGARSAIMSDIIPGIPPPVRDVTPTLPDLLDHQDLYKAYPWLAKVKVQRVHPSLTSNFGEWDAGANTIRLNAVLQPAQAMETLHHEIQHAIQDFEGFSRGGNARLGAQYAREALIPVEDKIALMGARIHEIEQSSDWTRLKDKLEADGYSKEALAKRNSEPLYREWEQLSNELDELARKHGYTLREVRNRVPEILPDGDAIHQHYRQIMGEMESRTTSKRARLMDYERAPLDPIEQQLQETKISRPEEAHFGVPHGSVFDMPEDQLLQTTPRGASGKNVPAKPEKPWPFLNQEGFEADQAAKRANQTVGQKLRAMARNTFLQTGPAPAEGLAGRGVARPVEEAIPGAVPTPTARNLPPADLSRSDIERRARLAQKAVNDLSERLKRIPVEETGGPTHQSMMEAQRAASRELAYYTEWARAGRRPPLGPHPTAAAVDRATAAARQGSAIRQDVGLSNYLTRAGVGTAKAAEQAAKVLPKDAAPGVKRAVTEALELGEKAGKAPDDVRQVAESIQGEYKRMLDAEQEWAVPTPALRDPRLGYTTRVVTKEGRTFFRRQQGEARAKLFMQLEQARRAKGLEPAAAATADYVSQTMERAARSPKGADVKNLPIPEAKRGWAEKQLRSLPPEVQSFIKTNGLEREYLAFEQVASTMHESQIARMPAYEGLSIPELNEVFRKAGARGEVFNENPAAQLFTRKARHEKAKAANQMFENLGRKVGQELPQEVTDWAEATGDGLEKFTTPGTGGEPLGYGIKEVNDLRRQRGMRPIVFDDRNTAAAVQKAMSKLLDTEETAPLLEWWDAATRTMKSWVTKAFPAYHVRNRMSNRMQSWLEDVPVAGEHYKAANRVLAGADTTFTTGAGEVLTRDEILEEAQNEGVLRGGFFESEFKAELFKKPSWNVLDSENRFVKAGEKVGAALTAAPGQLLSGAGPGRLGQMNANMVESIDRLGHYLFKRAQGLAPDQAAASVKKALFDYGDLNDFEQNVMGRTMFFYAYTRNVVPFMLDRAVARPGKVAALARVGGGAGGREGLPENMPVWAREGLPIPLGKDAQGNPMIAYGLGTPIEAAVEPFAGYMDGFQRGAEKTLSQLNPFARMPLEMATGRRFFLGQGIEEARKAPAWVGLLPVEIQKGMGVRQVPMKSGGVRLEMDPYDLYALENSPFGRLSNTIGKAVDTRKPGVARALNITTGAKVVSVDEEREAYLAVKRAKEKLLKELERRGLVQEMQDLYRVTPAGKESPQAVELKQLVRR
jgi:hypothetical protein